MKARCAGEKIILHRNSYILAAHLKPDIYHFVLISPFPLFFTGHVSFVRMFVHE